MNTYKCSAMYIHVLTIIQQKLYFRWMLRSNSRAFPVLSATNTCCRLATACLWLANTCDHLGGASCQHCYVITSCVAPNPIKARSQNARGIQYFVRQRDPVSPYCGVFSFFIPAESSPNPAEFIKEIVQVLANNCILIVCCYCEMCCAFAPKHWSVIFNGKWKTLSL